MLTPQQIQDARNKIGTNKTPAENVTGANLLSKIKGEQNYIERVKQGISQGVEQAKVDINSKDNRNAVSKGLSAVSSIASAVQTPISELPIVKQIGEGINKGINYTGEQLSKLYSPEFQASLADMSDEDFNEATQPLKDLANAGNIANTILMAKGGQKTASAITEKSSNVFDVIKSTPDKITQYPKEIGQYLSEKVTVLPEKVKNVLQTANIEKFDNYVKQGEKAIKDSRELTPLEIAGEKVDTQILPSIKEDLNRIGAQKSKTLESIKTTKMPKVGTDAIDFIREKTKAMKLTKEERNLVESLVGEIEKLGKTPTIGSVDKSVDLLQNTLFEKTKGLSIPVTSRVESLVNQTIGKINNSVKETAKKTLGADEYSVLNDSYAQKIELFNKLNKAIGEDASKGGSLFKKFFSPQDSGTKKLFADIKNQYGIDLAEDATLAKFVMDSLGDVRAKSLLEQVPLSKAGIVTKAIEKGVEKLTRPIQKARKEIMKRPPVQL